MSLSPLHHTSVPISVHECSKPPPTWVEFGNDVSLRGPYASPPMPSPNSPTSSAPQQYRSLPEIAHECSSPRPSLDAAGSIASVGSGMHLNAVLLNMQV